MSKKIKANKSGPRVSSIQQSTSFEEIASTSRENPLTDIINNSLFESHINRGKKSTQKPYPTASTPKHKLSRLKQADNSQPKLIHYHSKRKHRVAREIIKLRRTTDLLLRKLPFSRLVREIANGLKMPGGQYRWQTTALAAIQESAEYYLISLMEAAYQCSIHAKRVTLMPKDIRLVRFIRQED